MANKKIKRKKRLAPKKRLKVNRVTKIKSRKRHKPNSKTGKFRLMARPKRPPRKSRLARRSKRITQPPKKIRPMARLLLPLGRIKEIFRTRYGFFLYDGSEFVINTPETPTPWCNILTNGDYGMVISQAGGGMSFRGGIANRLTRWHQDLNNDEFGKFIYIRDNQTQNFWSATWKPVCKQPEFYEVRQGIGYTNITSKNQGIISSLIYYVAADEPIELWQLRIRNDTDQERFLSVFSYLEWDSDYPSGNREYDKLFIETSFNKELSAIFAQLPRQGYAFHSVNNKIATFTCGREFFLGLYHNASSPRCVEKGMCFGEKGRYSDPAACLHMEIELPPRGEKEMLFTVGVCEQQKDAETLIRKYKNVKVIEEEFSRTGQRWGIRLNNFQMTTPDEGVNILNNKWMRYQAVSAGLSCFGSYYNPNGVVDFKDYLINGLVLLSMNPKYHRPALLHCAEKQFADGLVTEEWDPKTQKGRKFGSLEMPLWLVYSVCEYLKETKDISILDEAVKFQDAPKQELFAHCTKALDVVLDSIGKTGVVPIFGKDYTKGQDVVYKDTIDKSVWLGEFLLYVLSEFINICALKQQKDLMFNYEARLAKVKDKLKKIAWDNDRIIKAISRTGRIIGISKGKDERLFLDTQVWAVISGLCEEKEAVGIMNNIKLRLYTNQGPLTLSPSFTNADEDTGLVSKLPPGIAENGGVSIEQACWAIWAETKLGRADNAWSIYTKLDSINRSNRSDIYRLEPFASCEYIDGPDAPSAGRARNPWYNRSAYWMFKVITENILGIKPTFEGLAISPCIPNRWRLFRVRRAFRNAYYTIEVVNPKYVSHGIEEVIIDGKTATSNIIPAFGDEKRHHVKVIMGRVR